MVGELRIRRLYFNDRVGHRLFTDDKSYLSNHINFVSVILSNEETMLTCNNHQSSDNFGVMSNDSKFQSKLCFLIIRPG